MFFKRLLVLSVLSASFLIPTFVSAQTCDIQCQIAAIQAQITALQQQLAGLQSANFQNGSKVETLVNLKVRSTPSIQGTALGMAPIHAQGTIRCDLAGNNTTSTCPTTADGYTWWYIDWDPASVPTGWSVQGTTEADYIQLVSTSIVPPPDPKVFGSCFTEKKKACETRMGVPPNEQDWQHPASYWSDVYLPCFNEAYSMCGSPTASTSTSGSGAACTQEAMQCPDGSTVGRTGPNCAFAACPGGGTTAAPTITSLQPTSGPVGTIVTITGTRFTPTNNAIKLGGIYVGDFFNSNGTTITFTVPEGGSPCPPDSSSGGVTCQAFAPLLPGSYPVTVQNANGTSNAKTFMVTGGQNATSTTGTGHIKATLNGANWPGSLTVHYQDSHGASGNATLTVPVDYLNVPIGSNTLSYVSGGPFGAWLKSITIIGPSCGTGCATITAGGNVTITFNFEKGTGFPNPSRPAVCPTFGRTNIEDEAWSSSCVVPKIAACVEAGGYPNGCPNFTNIRDACWGTAAACNIQAVTECDALTPKGTVRIGGTLNGAPWTGEFYATFSRGTGTGSGSGTLIKTCNVAGAMAFPNTVYTATYRSGGPAAAIFKNINGVGPTVSQTLTAGGTITFTFNFATP